MRARFIGTDWQNDNSLARVRFLDPIDAYHRDDDRESNDVYSLADARRGECEKDTTILPNVPDLIESSSAAAIDRRYQPVIPRRLITIRLTLATSRSGTFSVRHT